MRNFITVVAALSLLGLAACNKMSMSKPSLNSEDDKSIYFIGTDIGSKMKRLQLSQKELAIVKMGIDDGISGKKQIDLAAQQAKIGDFLRNRNKQFAEKESKDSEAFLKKAEGESGAQKTESGLIYVETAAGSGANPTATDRVKVHYHGTLRDGTVFDSSKDRGQPASFRLDRVIKCWTEGVQKMKVGGKSTLYCPSAIAYGERGAPPKIPGGAALKFEVELLEIIKEDAKPAAGKKKK